MFKIIKNLFLTTRAMFALLFQSLRLVVVSTIIHARRGEVVMPVMLVAKNEKHLDWYVKQIEMLERKSEKKWGE